MTSRIRNIAYIVNTVFGLLLLLNRITATVTPELTDLQEDILSYKTKFSEMKIHYENKLSGLHDEYGQQMAMFEKELKDINHRHAEEIKILQGEIIDLQRNCSLPISVVTEEFTLSTDGEELKDLSIDYLSEDEIASDNQKGGSRNGIGKDTTASSSSLIQQKGKKIARTVQTTKVQVAFDAVLSHTARDFQPNEAIIYDRVMTNLGNRYSNTTGHFTCNRSGTYVFFYRILVSKGNPIYVALTKNGKNISQIFGEDETNWSHAATMTVTHLEAGDVVKVKTAVYQEQILASDILDHEFTTFSGFLLYLDP